MKRLLWVYQALTAKRQQISQGAGWGDLFYVIILNTLNMISVLN